MNRVVSMRFFVVAVVLIFVSIHSNAQDCEVKKAALKGTYTGDCKNGKANGKGKAVGADTYEGEFRAGQPDGEGVYTWKNGNVYSGHFSNGMMDGKGTMVIKRGNEKDSLVQGYWKRDVYVGKFENPYTIFFKSMTITELSVDYKKEKYNQLTIYVTNTSGGSSTLSGELPKIKVDEVQLLKGSYSRMAYNYNHVKKTETTIEGLNLPFRAKFILGQENFEAEFREPGSYTINIYINL
jgi:hypothetical protein